MTANDNPQISTERALTRRQLLGATASSLALATAGCASTSDDKTDTETPEPEDAEVPETTNAPPASPRVEDPPETVYLPTHRTSMRHLDPIEAGDYTLGPMLTYPHRFWTITGDDTQEVPPGSPGVHLMFTVWDSETETVLPVEIGAETRTRKDGSVIDTRSPWPMISQTMGFHFGDNIPLPEDGTYTVEVDLNPIPTRRTGSFAGRFETGETVSFEFEWNREFRREVVDGVQYLDEDQWGNPGAMEPMGGMAQGEHNGDGDMSGEGDETGMNGDQGRMDGQMMPYSALPPADSYPGLALGPYDSGDATFVVSYLDESRLSEDGYLVISPRTPYNRVPLADMALSVTGAIEGEPVQTLDGEFGHHYGLSGTLSAGDSIELTADSPPQAARHRGYETAFLDMPAMTIEVPE